jgi:hypothetical protein
LSCPLLSSEHFNVAVEEKTGGCSQWWYEVKWSPDLFFAAEIGEIAQVSKHTQFLRIERIFFI